MNRSASWFLDKTPRRGVGGESLNFVALSPPLCCLCDLLTPMGSKASVDCGGLKARNRKVCFKSTGWVVAPRLWLRGFKPSSDMVGFLKWLVKVEEGSGRQDRKGWGQGESSMDGLGEAGSRSREQGMDGRGS